MTSVLASDGAGRSPARVWMLWGLTVLFFARVLGQAMVEFFGARFMPDSAEWDSGLLPYPVLLGVQVAILGIMAWIDIGVTRARGAFAKPRPKLGRFLLIFSIVYASVMVVRYFVSGALQPQRWFWPRPTIPILFHFVLAGYLYVLSRLSR
jgi:hypothetical protein